MKLYLFFNAVISVALAVPLLDSSIGSLEEDNRAVTCTGGNGCCSSSNKCQEGMGDCDNDGECTDGLTCGDNNCGDFTQNYIPDVYNSATGWDKTDDCCYKKGIACPYKGDEFCDDEDNTEECEYDGGDCCGDNVNKAYCGDKETGCKCLDPNFVHQAESDRHIYVQVQNSEVVSGGNACCGDAATTVTVTVGCNVTTEAPEAPSVYTTEEPIIPTEPTPQCPSIIIEVTVTVEIRDALDNHLVPAANVDVDGGAPAATNDDGQATFGGLCAGGSFTITVSCDGYEDASVAYEITDSGDGTMQITISLSTTLPEGQLRMVLNWGPDPTDLDSHAIQLSGTYDELCHVYYSNKQCPLVSLDLDNTQGGNNGAETITWSGRDSNIYLLYIKDYAPNPNVPMVASSATVNLYGNAPTVTIHIPTLDPNSPTASRYWILGSLDNNIGLSAFTMFNCLSSTEPQGYGGDGMAEVCDVVN